MGVVDDVQSYLTTQGIVDGSSGWASVRRHLHDGADQLVVFTEDGGPAPQLASATGMGDVASQRSGLQVRVRAARLDSDSAYDKAREIMDALHSLTGTTLGSTVYEAVYASTSEPVFIGFDDNGRPEYTQSFRLMSPVPA